MCYHYFIENLDSESNLLFMCTTCLNPCALMSEIGTFLLLHCHALFLHLETVPSYLLIKFPFLTLGNCTLVPFGLTLISPFQFAYFLHDFLVGLFFHSFYLFCFYGSLFIFPQFPISVKTSWFHKVSCTPLSPPITSTKSKIQYIHHIK